MIAAATPALLLFFGLGAAAPPAPMPGLPRLAPMTADFPEASLQMVLERLGETAGVKIVFDQGFRDKVVDWKVDQETFDVALQKLFIVHKKAGREIQPNVIVIYEDQPTMHRKYAEWSPSGPVAAVRNREPIRMSFTDDTSLQKVMVALGRHAGVNVVFDEGFRDRNVKARFDGETLEAALDQLEAPYGLFHQALDATTIVVATDQPQARRRYGFNDGLPLVETEEVGCGDPATWRRWFGSRLKFGNGLELSFSAGVAASSGEVLPLPIYKRSETVMLPGGRLGVDRIVGDITPSMTKVRGYVGYRLELAARDGKSFRAELKPLPEASWKRMCAACAAASQARIGRYPAPFDIGVGGSFTVELMTHANGQKVVDLIKFLQPATERPEPSRVRRFKVEWRMAREVGHLKAGLCIRDLDSGAVLGGISSVPVFPWSDAVVVSEEGRTKDGKPLSVVARVAPADDRRTVVYGVELWEAGELVHAEETRLPLVVY